MTQPAIPDDDANPDVQWWYRDAQKTWGPFSQSVLMSLLATKEITPETLVYCKGMDDWQPIKALAQFSIPTGSPSTRKAARLHNPPKRILVVEDDESVLQLYSDVLLRAGYHVETAKDGDEGWKVHFAAKRSSDTYDLLITDNSMPNVTGVELITMLRAANMNLPVILATGMAPANTNHLGLSAILTKPFTTTELLQTVGEVLHKNEQE